MNRMIPPIVAMAALVALSNYTVQFPINDWLTWGALTYPVTFLVTDLTNRALGPARARIVVLVGFVLAVALSIWLATPRIALASGAAFLFAQLLDVAVFNRFRQTDKWWAAPLAGSVIGSVLDTFLFFSIAFQGTDMPWVTLALGDLLVKGAMALVLLAPYGWALPYLVPFERRAPERRVSPG